MRTVFLLSGFNNWGKTTLLRGLFSSYAFHKGTLYDFAGFSFCVLPQSNDDIGKPKYEDAYHERIAVLAAAGKSPKYIASAFCPSRESNNNSIDILRTLYARDEVVILAIEHKWCGHAKLVLPEVERFYMAEGNVTFHGITEKDPSKKLEAVRKVFRAALP